MSDASYGDDEFDDDDEESVEPSTTERPAGSTPVSVSELLRF